MLNDVCLEEFMIPCLVYALKRATNGMTKKELDKLPKLDMPDNENKIPVGAILFWENAEGEKTWHLTVEDRIVLETYTFNRGHWGVYEGDGLYSDIGYSDDNKLYIRFRKYKETRPADKMIIIK